MTALSLAVIAAFTAVLARLLIAIARGEGCTSDEAAQRRDIQRKVREMRG